MKRYYRRGLALLIGVTLLVSNNVNTVMATELPDNFTEVITEATEFLTSESASADTQTSDSEMITGEAQTAESDAAEITAAQETENISENPYGTEEGDGTGEAYSSVSSDSYTGYSTDYPNTWTNTGDQAVDITQIALTQVGYTETDDNHTKYAAWWCGSDTAYAWCGIFIAWCADQAGIPTSIIKKNGLASGYNESNMASNPYGCPAYSFSSTSAKVGDIIFVDSTSNGTSNHVGLVYAVDSTYIYTVEGNYSDKVSLVKYQVSSGCRQLSSYTSKAHILFYARPSYNNKASVVSTQTESKATETASTQTPASESSQTSEEEAALGVYRITASSLNVRTGPASSYSKLGTLAKNEIVEVYEINNGWGKIQYAGDSGWISMSYCEEVEDTPAASEAASETTGSQTPVSTQTTQTVQDSGSTAGTSVTYPVYTTTTALNVRSGPGTSYGTIGTLPSGTAETILEKSGSWGRFDYSGKDGWIYLGYCSQTGTVTISTGNNSTAGTQTKETQTSQTKETQTSQTTETQAAQTSEYETGRYKVTASSLNVRSGAGTSYSKLGVLAEGTEITVTEVKGSWGKIDYNGQEGWTSLAYCEKIEDRTALVITKQPQDVVVKRAGDTATVSVAAEGDGLTYAWYIKNPGASSFTKSTVTTASHSFSVKQERDGRQMYCLVTDQYGNSVKSNTVTISISDAITITEQPKNAVVSKVGETAQFSVQAEGDELTYQWYVKNPTASSFTATSITTPSHSFSVKKERNGRMLYCVITDKNGNQVKTDTVTVWVQGTLVITQQPKSVTVANSGDMANITVAALGDDLTYTWYYKNAGDSSFVKSSVTGDTYSYAVTAARNGRQVYCVITDANGNTVTSNTATMSIKQ